MSARLFRGVRKLLAGVPLGGERVWPGAANDLFVAHLSIYRYFAREAAGRRVLDVGCGLGYGAALLAEAGARSVLGLDVDPRAVRYARRTYRQPGLSFDVADAERLSLDAGRFDLVTASNVLEHLLVPARFLTAAREGLAPGGRILVAVPPNNAPELRADNDENPHHHSNLDVVGWTKLFEREGFDVRAFRHSHPEMANLDFASSATSRFRAEDFLFEEISSDALAGSLTLTAVFFLRSAG